jgi:hypothetical protein
MSEELDDIWDEDDEMDRTEFYDDGAIEQAKSDFAKDETSKPLEDEDMRANKRMYLRTQRFDNVDDQPENIW